MRKHYVDNIRWITVLLVVVYHVIYMYNGVATAGVIGPFKEVQYQDAVLYLLYPWFMVILFVISGMCSRYYLEQHTRKEFIVSRTRKLLVPSTIGLFVFQWIQGYFSMAISNAFTVMADEVPGPVLYLIMVLSGTGVLWYMQLLWIFSMGLVLVHKLEKGRLYGLCAKTNPFVLIALGVLVWAMAQILNTPVIAVYRFGIYGTAFLLGYFVFARAEVMERLSKYWLFFGIAAVLLGIIYTCCYYGENYAMEPVVNNPLAIAYGWTAVLAIFAGMKKWMDYDTPLFRWMQGKSFGLYVFHYLPLSAVSYFLNRYTQVPALAAYVISAAAAFAGGLLLYEIIVRIPLLRWCVLGVKKNKLPAK